MSIYGLDVSWRRLHSCLLPSLAALLLPLGAEARVVHAPLWWGAIAAVNAPAECIDGGGQNICGGREARPATPTYNVCYVTNTDHVGYSATDCTVRGGTWNPNNQSCASPTPFTDANMAGFAQETQRLKNAACTIDTTDSGWGASFAVENACANANAGTEYQYGVEIIAYRDFQHHGTNGATCGMPFSAESIGARSRTISIGTCAQGYTLFGDAICKRLPDLTCPLNNPVQAGTGAKIQVDTDIAATSAGSVKFLRTYNSFGYWLPLGSTVAFRPGMFGQYWRSNYDSRLIETPSSTFTLAAVQRPDGQVKYFKTTGAEAFPLSDRPADRLARVTTTSCAAPPSPTAVAWRYTTGADQVEEYNCAGDLLTIVDRDNKVQSLAYDSAARLISAIDEHGRRIMFAYNGDSRRVAKATDAVGVEYAYGYDELGRLATVASATGSGNSTVVRQYHYEDANWYYALTGITNERGVRFATYAYDAQGRVSTSVHAPATASGTIDKFTYAYATDVKGNLTTTVVDALGMSSVYTYGNPGATEPVRFKSVTQPCTSCGGATVQSRTYDSMGFTDIVRDFRGTETDYTADTSGRVLQRIDASNLSCALGQPCDRRTLSTVWHSTYNVPLTQSTQDSAGAFESKRALAYNSRGQTTARCDIDPGVAGAQTYVCGSSANAPTGVRQSTYVYCDAININPPDPIGIGGENLQKGCPVIGLLRRIDGPRTNVNDRSTLEYRLGDDPSCATNGACAYRAGDAWKAINALGHVTEYVSYDKSGRVTRTKDANGVITDMSYHPRGWLATRTMRASPNGTPDLANDATTVMGYDATGNVIKVTRPDASFLEYSYDNANRLVAINDNTGAHIDYVLDAAGNRKVEKTFGSAGTADLKRRIAREFDLLSRLDIERDALTAAGAPLAGLDVDDNTKGRLLNDHAYDGNGNRTASVDGLSRDTGMVYDPLNRLKQTLADRTGTDPNTHNASTGYAYDARDNLRTVTDPKGLVTTYVYDGLNDQTQLQSPDTGATTYTYDAAGNRVTQTDARSVPVTSTYIYDELNRLTAITYPTAALNTAFYYDAVNSDCAVGETFAAGHLTRMTDASGETRYCYDRRGNTVVKVQVTAGIALRTAWTYDNADRIATIAMSSGTTVFYTRDSLGRVATIVVKDSNSGKNGTPVVTAASYYPMGPLKQLTFGDASTLTKTYDNNYRIDSVASSFSFGLKLDFATDVVGTIANVSDAIGGAPVNTYEYDALYRLTSVRDFNNSLIAAYSYDATGNRTSKQLGAAPVQSYTYPSTSHRLATVGGIGRSYDNIGNTTAMPLPTTAGTLNYDDRNRLTATTVNSATATYQYNGRGERVQKIFNGETTRYAYDLAGHLLGEYRPDGTLRAEYVWLDDLPLAVKLGPLYGSMLYFLETDHLGTPRRIDTQITVQGGGGTRWSWPLINDPFGEQPAPLINNCPPIGPCSAVDFDLNLRFPGQYADAETGLNYNYFRDYEAGTGRYAESDPIGLQGGLNSYGYVFSSPLGLIDWTGGSATAVIGPAVRPVVPDIIALCIRFPLACSGAGGFAAGTLAYPIIEPTITKIVEMCTTVECVPPKGTICFIIDRVPPSKPHYPIIGSHYHLWQMNQAPDGGCHWNYLDASSYAPPGAIPCPFIRK